MESAMSEKDLELVSQFVEAHPYGNIFQTPEMFQFYSKTKNHEPVLVTVEDNGKIAGVLLAVIQKEGSGMMGTLTSRSIIWGGPLVKNNDPAILDRLLKKYFEKIKGKAIYSQFRNQWPWSDAEKKVFEQHGAEYEEHLNILVDLKKDKDALWKDVHTKRRNEIKRGIKEGTTFEVKNDLESLSECHKILSSVYKRAKLPFPSFDFFSNLHAVSSERKGLKMFTAWNGGKIIGCMLGLVYKTTIYDFYAGSYSEYYSKYPNDVIPWQVFLWGKEAGYTTFDFGGAGKPDVPYGVREYKKKFGGELVEYGRYLKIHNGALYKLGVLLLKTYKLVMNGIRSKGK